MWQEKCSTLKVKVGGDNSCRSRKVEKSFDDVSLLVTRWIIKSLHYKFWDATFNVDFTLDFEPVGDIESICHLAPVVKICFISRLITKIFSCKTSENLFLIFKLCFQVLLYSMQSKCLFQLMSRPFWSTFCYSD